MDGYNIEELYYLYRQNNYVAKKLLVEYCYWLVELTIPAYYFYSGFYRDEREDCIQDIVFRCIKSIDSYRPDKGMLFKSYLSLLAQRSISSVMVRERRKRSRERMVAFSLDGYCSDDEKISYLDVVKDEEITYQPDAKVLQNEQEKLLNKYISEKCSGFEKSIIEGHEQGYKDTEIAKMMQLDAKKIYNANYRIQKKMSKLKLFD